MSTKLSLSAVNTNGIDIDVNSTLRAVYLKFIVSPPAQWWGHGRTGEERNWLPVPPSEVLEMGFRFVHVVPSLPSSSPPVKTQVQEESEHDGRIAASLISVLGPAAEDPGVGILLARALTSPS